MIGKDKGKIETAKAAIRPNEASKLGLSLLNPSRSLLQTSNNMPSVSIKTTMRLVQGSFAYAFNPRI